MRKTAFTMIEIMVTIGLAVIVLTVSTISYRQITSRNQMILQVNQIAVDLRQAQSYAASGQEYQNVAGQNVWGFYANASVNDRYIIFNDINLDGQYSGGEATKTIKLARGLFIKELACLNPTLNAQSDVNAVFTPPDPLTTIKVGGNTACQEFFISIQDNKGTTKQVVVNAFGLIDITR
jgi:Tfp pilus assembly protein FimT